MKRLEEFSKKKHIIACKKELSITVVPLVCNGKPEIPGYEYNRFIYLFNFSSIFT